MYLCVLVYVICVACKNGMLYVLALKGSSFNEQTTACIQNKFSLNLNACSYT